MVVAGNWCNLFVIPDMEVTFFSFFRYYLTTILISVSNCNSISLQAFLYIEHTVGKYSDKIFYISMDLHIIICCLEVQVEEFSFIFSFVVSIWLFLMSSPFKIQEFSIFVLWDGYVMLKLNFSFKYHGLYNDDIRLSSHQMRIMR